MAGNWRDDVRYGPDGRPRNRWGDDASRDRSDDYAFGRNERRGPGGRRDYGPFGEQRDYGEPGLGASYGPSYADYGGAGDGYPDFDRAAPQGGNPWRNRSVDGGRERPTGWGPDWGDAHGRWGGRGVAGGYAAGTRGDSAGDFGYGRGARGPGYRNDRDFWDRASDEVASWFGDDDAERRRRMDAREDHRGRGPKGYTRSDDRIREDVSDALSDDDRLDAREISVSVSGAEVTLDGTVDSRFAKRRAEDCAERVSGVTHVQNNLRVRTTSASEGMTTATGAPGATGVPTKGSKQI